MCKSNCTYDWKSEMTVIIKGSQALVHIESDRYGPAIKV